MNRSGSIQVLRSLSQRASAGFIMFFLSPSSSAPLGFFRIAVSMIAINQVIILWPYLLQLYGNFGFIQWAVIEASNDTWLPSIGKLSVMLQRYGISADDTVRGIFATYLGSLIGLAVGWHSRLFAVIAWLTHILTVNSGDMSLYGVDTMIHICLFYCIWMPVGDSYSIDRWRAGKSLVPSWFTTLSLRTLQLHLCIIYWNSGFAKMLGQQWWSGEAIWRALTQPQFAVFDFFWLAHFPLMAKLVCWSVMIVEAGYPIFIWPQRTRPYWLAGILTLHIAIGVFMGLWLFSLTLIVMNLSAFGIQLRREYAEADLLAAGRKLQA
jgi:hypothetical protein